MLVGLIYWFKYYLIPDLSTGAAALVYSLMPCAIIIVGIGYVIKSLSPKSFRNLGSSMASRIVTAVIYIVKTFVIGIWKAIKFIVQKLSEWLPKIFRKVKTVLIEKDVSVGLSNAIATLVVLLIVVLII